MASRQLRGYQGLAILLAVVLVYLVLSRHIVRGAELLLFVVLVPSIILHEVSHGAVAYLFGDDTAKQAGRLTLNPIPHIDLFGSIILPAILVLGGFPAFGYAKPVPVNVGRLRSPRNQSLIVSLAGPAVNVILAVGAAFAFRALVSSSPFVTVDSLPIGLKLLLYLGEANVLLAVFNLIPLPPLDGSAVVERLLPRAWWPGYLRIRMFSLPIVLLLVFLVPSALGHVFNPALNLWSRLLLPR